MGVGLANEEAKLVLELLKVERLGVVGDHEDVGILMII